MDSMDSQVILAAVRFWTCVKDLANRIVGGPEINESKAFCIVA